MHSLSLARSTSRATSRRRPHPRGYSLLEILVVLAIIALLASVIGIAVYGHLVKARIETTRQSALAIRRTVVLYRMDRGDDCPNVEQLRQSELIDSASKTTDAWDGAFLVKCGERGEVHVSSAGPDKKHGTEDDIVAPEPPAKVVTRE
jgi:prepilin-type N-terminal cleavage/methylation domain-containing protein